MSDTVSDIPQPGTDLDTPVLARLSTLDRFLPVWIVVAMARCPAGSACSRSRSTWACGRSPARSSSSSASRCFAGFLTRVLGERARGRQWYETRLLPRIGPVALHGLLFTIVVLFALQGDTIARQPLDVARIAVPLLLYCFLTFAGSFFLGHRPAWGTRVRRRSRSPLPATTSSWRSP